MIKLSGSSVRSLLKTPVIRRQCTFPATDAKNSLPTDVLFCSKNFLLTQTRLELPNQEKPLVFLLSKSQIILNKVREISNRNYI